MNTADSQPCSVCRGANRFAFEQPLLGRMVSYFDCPNCGYFQTESPYWLEEAYASAINEVDTGILWRNQLNVRRVVMTLLAFGRLGGSVVDHAGGYGILVRLLRNAGVAARWRDKYCQNLLARGFEATDTSYDVLTAFEVFEHLEDPLHELGSVLEIAPVVLLSTELVPGVGTPSTDWWYLGPEHGQHIGFARLKTFKWMADEVGCYFASDGRSLHLFSKNPIPGNWLVLIKLGRLASLVSSIGLRSKTIEDFEFLRSGR